MGDEHQGAGAGMDTSATPSRGTTAASRAVLQVLGLLKGGTLEVHTRSGKPSKCVLSGVGFLSGASLRVRWWLRSGCAAS
jgi:hypothetical protein